MRPEDVPDELVEKAARALSDAIIDRTAEMAEDAVRVTLAAVLPAIQAQALQEAADVLDRPRVIWYGDGGVTVLEAGADATIDDYRAERPTVVEWLRARAARLAETSEGTTT